MTAPNAGTTLAQLFADTRLYRFTQVDEMGMCAITVVEEIRNRLVLRFGADNLAAAQLAAQVCDTYAREQIEQAIEDQDGEPGDCFCEDGDCKGHCCGVGRCSCTPGFELAVEISMGMEEQR